MVEYNSKVHHTPNKKIHVQTLNVTPQFSGILKMLEKFKNFVSCLFVVGLSTLVGL